MSKQLTVVDEIRGTVSAMKPQFAAALPAHINVEKFSRVLMTAVSSQPDLQEANRTSLFSSCMKLAQQGLLPDGKEAAIVTFRNKQGDKIAQAMPMVAGILKLVRNSGELSSITAQLVYEKDDFKYWVDTDGEHLNHSPRMFGDRGKVIGVYALAKTKDGAVYIEVMTEAEVMAVKGASRSKDSGPWAGAFAHEMYKKTAIRRLSKRLPMSTDVEEVIKSDDDGFEPIPEKVAREIVESSPEPEPVQKKSKLQQAVLEQKPPAKVVKNYAPGAEESSEESPL